MQMKSPENYVRTQARSLPIDTCYINEGWEEVGLAHVIVNRRHVTGNLTYALYLVDTNCLGIKDTWFVFNVTPDELEESLVRGRFEAIDYNLAHNIIYGAEAFAADYGFKAHKDWV